MGLRGLHAKPLADRPRPPDEPTISNHALAIYRRMRRLELHCDCPDGVDPDEMCANCTELWRLNGELSGCFGLPAWQFAYWDPRWKSHRPMQSAIDRFHLLERAASKAAKKPKFKYKWQK